MHSRETKRISGTIMLLMLPPSMLRTVTLFPFSRSTGTAFVSRHLLLKLIIPAAYEVRSIHDTKDNINFKLACLFRLLMGTFETGSQDFIKQEALSFLE